jgi:glycosyltransferase involved in cell wall biosynthesis
MRRADEKVARLPLRFGSVMRVMPHEAARVCGVPQAKRILGPVCGMLEMELPGVRPRVHAAMVDGVGEVAASGRTRTSRVPLPAVGVLFQRGGKAAQNTVMRVLHVIAGAEIGGAETFAVDAIGALAERGVQQHVICRPYMAQRRRYAAAGIPTSWYGFSAFDRFFRPGVIDGIARQFQPDVVHAWMSRAGSVVPRKLACPAVGWFGDYYNLKYFRTCDSFFAVTADIAAFIVKQGVPAERVFVTNTFGTMPDAPAVDRAGLDTPPDAKVALVLSRLHTVKGIDTMLHAAADVPGLYVWIAGDGPERGSYEALAGRLGLRDRVRFLGWRSDRKSLLEACDICVLPSRYEPFGTVIVEAWAADRPLVATAADGARCYVHDGADGLLCAIDDAPALAACLLRVMREPGLADRLARAGRLRFEADFTRDIVIDRLVDAYGQAIDLGKLERTR